MRSTASRSRSLVSAVVGLVAVVGTSCQTSTGVMLDPSRVEAGISALSGPTQADLAALYRVRGRAAGSLRLTVLTHGDEGRFSLSETMGSALSVAAWGGGGRTTLYDLREGCRLSGAGAAEVFGFQALPLPQAARMLAGRLPATADDLVSVRADGRVLVAGTGWEAVVTVMPDPWRVTRVAAAGSGGADSSWVIEVSQHAGSMPIEVEAVAADGRWVRLAAVRVEWRRTDDLPPLPELPPCAARGAG